MRQRQELYVKYYRHTHYSYAYYRRGSSLSSLRGIRKKISGLIYAYCLNDCRF